MTARRDFLKGILAACVAPAFVPVERLMRIKPIVVPRHKWDLECYILTHDGRRVDLTVDSFNGGLVRLAKPYTTLAGDRLVIEKWGMASDLQWTSDPLPAQEIVEDSRRTRVYMESAQPQWVGADFAAAWVYPTA